MAGSATRDWDAGSYHRVSVPHEEWAQPEPAEFLGTVCLGPQLDRLPEGLRDPFVAAVLEAEPAPLELDYVRLNIDAQ